MNGLKRGKLERLINWAPLSRGGKLWRRRKEYSPRLAPEEDLDGEREVVVAPAGAVVLRLVPRANHVAVLARQI